SLRYLEFIYAPLEIAPATCADGAVTITTRSSIMADPTGISRRELLARGALLGGGALVAGPLLASCGSSAGGGKGSLEIGVLYQAGAPYYKAYQRVGDEIKKNHKGTKVTYTFANTAARPKLQLRWKKGNPPTLDYVFNSADRTSLHYVTD